MVYDLSWQIGGVNGYCFLDFPMTLRVIQAAFANPNVPASTGTTFTTLEYQLHGCIDKLTVQVHTFNMFR